MTQSRTNRTIYARALVIHELQLVDYLEFKNCKQFSQLILTLTPKRQLLGSQSNLFRRYRPQL